MHKPESVLENETNKIFWDFMRQTDRLILTRKYDPALIYEKKRTYRIVYFAVSVDNRVKIKEN